MSGSEERAPIVVIEGGEVGVEEYCAGLRERGWRLQHGWKLPTHPWDQSEARIVCSGTVSSSEDAGGAVLAAARGAGLVVRLQLEGQPELERRFMGDLDRLGTVQQHRVDASGAGPLEAEEVAILERMAAGDSVGDVAERYHMSRRTAERRLKQIRDKLGARTTAEAIVRLEQLLEG